ncbi:hypothetical protein D3C71_174570 [compost metagenome]
MSTNQSLVDFVAGKLEFLSAPGCDPDIEELENIVGCEDGDRIEILSSWFDQTAERFLESENIDVFRHLTAPDFDRIVAEINSGVAELGDHWSEDPGIWSHYADALGDNIRVAGRISSEQVDWMTTFQRQLAFPAEREVVFHGGVDVRMIENLDDSTVWASSAVTP